MGGYRKKLYVLCESLNKKELCEKGHQFTVSGVVVFSKEITQDEFEEYKTYTYEMIYGELHPILIHKDSPIEFRKRILGAALSYSLMSDTVDDIIQDYIEVIKE